jgi:hypothetical protein
VSNKTEDLYEDVNHEWFCAYHMRIEIPRDVERIYIRCGECWHAFTEADLVRLDSEHRGGKRLLANEIHVCPVCAHDL